MISNFVADVLAKYLGAVIDVNKEKLRVSLFQGAFFRQNIPPLLPPSSSLAHTHDLSPPLTHFLHAGIQLENVRLRPEFVDELDLPVKLLKGSIGSLKVQLPYTAVFTSRPLTVEL